MVNVHLKLAVLSSAREEGDDHDGAHNDNGVNLMPHALKIVTHEV